MSFALHMQSTIQRYMEATGLTPEGIPQSQYFTALAYFQEQNHYFDLDEIGDPKPGVTYFIRVTGTRLQYRWIDGKWRYIQEVEDSIYK